MKLDFSNIHPYIRFAGIVEYTTERQPSVAYDTRMLLITKGFGTFSLNDRVILLKPGMLILFQPPTVYAFHPDPSFEAVAIDFDFTQDYRSDSHFYLPCLTSTFQPEDAHEEVTFYPPYDLDFPLVQENCVLLLNDLERICHEKKYSLPFSDEKASFLLCSVLSDVLRMKKSEGKRSKTLFLLLSYIADHINEPISNQKIARDLHFDPCYLNRLMLSYSGKTLHQYVLEFRIHAAIHKLASSDESIESIAETFGFTTGSHFSNACFDKTGFRPSNFRQSQSLVRKDSLDGEQSEK